MYKDISTYSRGETERNPKILSCEINGLEFIVHKHIYYGNEWLLTCRELGIEKFELKTEDIEGAKSVVENKIVELLNECIIKYDKVIKELSK